MTFKEGDEVIWLKPVKMRLESSTNSRCLRGEVIDAGHDSQMGNSWLFYKDSGVWQSGTLEKDGCLVHPGFKVESGPAPERCNFEDRDLVLVRDSKEARWKLDAFKRFDKGAVYPYSTYTSCFRYCIPYAGNECKLGEVTD